jgi:hypothetical protein
MLFLVLLPWSSPVHTMVGDFSSSAMNFAVSLFFLSNVETLRNSQGGELYGRILFVFESVRKA